MAELIEHGLSFTEQRPDGSHKLGKRAVVIGAGIGGLATAGALARYFEEVDIWSATGWRRPRDRAPARRRIGTHMACWLADCARSIRFSPVSSIISPLPAPSRSGSRATFNSSGPMSARCRSGISEYQCCAQRGR
jgi:hypothetical protein